MAHCSIAGACITAALAILALMVVRHTNVSLMKVLRAIVTVGRISLWRGRIRRPGLASILFRKAWLTSRLEAGTGSTCSVLPCTRSASGSMLLPTAGSGLLRIWCVEVGYWGLLTWSGPVVSIG